jgi:hypothetical protein
VHCAPPERPFREFQADSSSYHQPPSHQEQVAEGEECEQLGLVVAHHRYANCGSRLAQIMMRKTDFLFRFSDYRLRIAFFRSRKADVTSRDARYWPLMPQAASRTSFPQIRSRRVSKHNQHRALKHIVLGKLPSGQGP